MFAALARYIAAAKEPGEKLERLWMVNTFGADAVQDLELAIREVKAVQALNTRVKGDRNYHLMVSLRAGERPSVEAMADVEREFAQALGFGEHQRVAATHENAGNYHLHVAINRIHPMTGKGRWPSHDYRAMEQVCRAMEAKYGLEVDRGRSDVMEGSRTPPGAQDKEAQSWEQSFYGYVKEHETELAERLDASKGWAGVHAAFAQYDLRLKPRGAGLVIMDRNKRHPLKASALVRAFSKAALEARFGPFEAPAPKRAARQTKPRTRYRRRPLTRHAGQARLWRRFSGARSTLLGRMAANWKTYLISQAYTDPLAMVIVTAHFELLHALTARPRARPRIERAPAALKGALAAWARSGAWATAARAGDKDRARRPRPWPGVKVDAQGRWLVPFRDKANRIAGFKLIKTDGASMDIGTVGKPGLMHVVDPEGRLAPGGTTVVTADPGAVAAIRTAVRVPVVLSPSAKAIEGVRRTLQRRHRGLNVVAAVTTAPAGLATPAQKAVVIDPAAKPAELRAQLAPALGDEAYRAWAKATTWANPGNTPWLKAAGVRGFGLKRAETGEVLMPLKDANGRLHRARVFSESGEARELDGPAQPPGIEGPVLMHVIDPERRLDEDPLVIATDYVSAAAIHRETRLPVVVAADPDPAEWAPVAEAIRERHRDRNIIVALPAGAGLADEPVARDAGLALVRPPEGAATFAELARDTTGRIRRTLAPETGDRAFMLWDQAKPVEDSLEREDAKGHRLRPLEDAAGRLWGVEVVDAGGGTGAFIGEARRQGLFQVVGREPFAARTPLVVVAQRSFAEALNEATGRAVACALGQDNLEPVVAALRKTHRRARIAVALDAEAPAELTRALNRHGARLIVPALGDTKEGPDRTTFAAWWRCHPREAKRAVIDALFTNSAGRAKGPAREKAASRPRAPHQGRER